MRVKESGTIIIRTYLSGEAQPRMAYGTISDGCGTHLLDGTQAQRVLDIVRDIAYKGPNIEMADLPERED